jgi:hypothetical protein
MSTTGLFRLPGERRPLGADRVWEIARMLIANATDAVHEARQRHRRELAERTRLRRLVERVDTVIEACEEAHLQGFKECPPDLADAAARVFSNARRCVRLTGDMAATQLVRDVCARPRPKITDTMDGLWTVQEVVFDLMLPWRTELPDDVELVGGALPTWRFNAA